MQNGLLGTSIILDTDGLLAAIFILTLHPFLLSHAPQGDVFQTKTEEVSSVVLRLAFYRRVEV